MNSKLLKKAQKWATSWSVPLLCPIPIPGHASTSQWKTCVEGTTEAPGRNHPTVGQWLLHRYGGPRIVAADPMVGAAGLWIDGREFVERLYANECESKLTRVSAKNLASAGYVTWEKRVHGLASYQVSNDDARTWRPDRWSIDRKSIKNKKAAKKVFLPVDLIVTSPPFGKNHDAGNTGVNKDCVEDKNLHAAQAWGKDPRNIGNLKGWRLWEALLQIYGQMASYLKKGGTAVVILRNYIRDGKDVDDVGNHLVLMRMAGFKIVGVHPREVWATGHRAKYVHTMGMPYTDLEFTVVLTK